MNCPFPGMDPYLEDPAFWPDFHQRFITYLCDELASGLPDNYEVRIDERVNLVELPADSVKQIRPDLTISQTHPLPEFAAGDSVSTATLEPVTMPLLFLDEDVEAYLQILHRPDRTLVTVLELLSPTNKTDPGRSDYFAKRNAILRQAVHLVELDLLVGGHRVPMRRPLPPGDYYAFVSRWDTRPNCDVYAWSLRSPLPRIRIPLRAPDPDLLFDLGGVFHEAYDRGRYARSLPYAAPPKAPLANADQSWAAAIAKSRAESRPVTP